MERNSNTLTKAQRQNKGFLWNYRKMASCLAKIFITY